MCKYAYVYVCMYVCMCIVCMAGGYMHVCMLLLQRGIQGFRAGTESCIERHVLDASITVVGMIMVMSVGMVTVMVTVSVFLKTKYFSINKYEKATFKNR